MLALLLAALWQGALPAPAAAQSRSYTVDAHASSVQVLAYRKGLFSLLAHDHVFVADGFAGRVTFDPADLTRAALQLTVPVASMLVDPQDARDALGLEGKLDDSDRAEIKANMLAPDQLDGAQYPRVTATLASASGKLPDLTLAVRVRIRQVEKVLNVPVHVELTSGQLLATGQLELLQSDFGIEPYSTLFGAIAVKNRVQVRFRILARVDAG
ncbi:MAG TPA: YceI family protein [bacterium]|nr:YceI family protein [bacterium]